MSNVTAFCNECGTTRTASPRYLPRRGSRGLTCTSCQRVTEHVRLGGEDDREAHNAKRPLRPYNPAADLAKRWPGWKFYRMPLVDGAFSILVASKAILLDEEWSAGDPWMESYSLAFVIAHLDLHFATVDSGGRFSEEESVVAEREALRRMEEFMPTWSTKQ